jgi:single-stranded-DNA-specific exonuclease
VLVPGARFDDVRTMGEGRHARFSVSSAGARARAVAFGCEGRLPVDPGEPADASFRLERNVWNGAVEARLVLRHARRCETPPIALLGEPEDFLRSAFAELDAPLDRDPASRAPGRRLLDRRGESPLAVLHDALAAGGPVLGICADVPRRLTGISSRIGGFTLASYAALHDHVEAIHGFAHLVALDPPARPCDGELLEVGAGFTHWVWGEAELRFAEQMHELEYGLRASLASLYRALRARGRVTGEELEHLLRDDGDQAPPRPARLAGRLIRVLAELGLVSLDRELPALAIAGTAPTQLERSPSYRVYVQRLEDGRRFLSSGKLRPSG